MKAAYILLLFFIGNTSSACARSNISEMSREKFQSKNYAAADYIVQSKFHVVNAYEWEYDGERGILTTVLPDDSHPARECLVLSDKGGKLNLVGNSLIHFQCLWHTEAPVMQQLGKNRRINFYTRTDVTGGDTDYSDTKIELYFKKSRKDFCMFGEDVDQWSKCKRY